MKSYSRMNWSKQTLYLLITYFVYSLGLKNYYIIVILNSTMIKAVLIGIISIVCCFTTLFFTRYLAYSITLKAINKLQDKSIAYYTQLYQNGSLQNTNYNESHPVIKSLTRLIQFPIIGQFFMDEKIYQLAKLQHWTGIINEVDYIIKTPANKYNFAVWFHKALAECNLGMLDKCEQSAKTVQLIAGNKQQRKYSVWFYEELKDLKKGKQPSSFKEILDL